MRSTIVRTCGIAFALSLGAVHLAWAQEPAHLTLDSTAQVLLRHVSVLVTPRLLVLDPQHRMASLTLTNPGDSLLHASVQWEFSYPATDAQGRTALTSTLPATVATSPSLIPWVHGVPTEVTLRPHQTQAVTMTLQVPPSTPDGEYWAQLVVVRPNTPLLLAAHTAAGVATTVHAQLTLRDEVSVFYRQGAMTTGLTLTQPQATVTDGVVRACVHVHRTGTAHFAGSVHVAIHDDRTGRDTLATTLPLAVYYALAPCYSVSVPGLAPGHYTVTLRYDTTDRPDLPSAFQLPMTPVQAAIPFEIPGPVK